MSSHVSEEELQRLIHQLTDKLIVVEGKKDEEALKSLGLKNIIVIDGRSLYEIAGMLKERKEEIVILTDFDSKGRHLNSKLKFLLQKYKKRVNSKLRGKMMRLGKNKIEDMSNLKEVDAHVEVSSYFNKIRNKGSNKCKGSNRKT
ncbi:MAG: toprim domain-containing protein [Candidatus Aenigmarchaeota archaeon]|nr:toprim domain-containing protein [Candidatus Aenigmarchaeota archaeon]